MDFYQTKPVSVAALIPYALNARTHSDEQVAQIAASIDETTGGENWRFCLENDCYVATISGGIYRVCRRQKTKSGTLSERYETVKMSGSMDKHGYITYHMVVDGEKKHIKGHRLVLRAFDGDHPDKQVNHKDGNKTNNRLSNLEWVTSGQNQKHAIQTGLKNPYKLNVKNQKVPWWDWVTIYAMAKHAGMPRTVIADRNGVCRQTIDSIIAKVQKEIDHAEV